MTKAEINKRIFVSDKKKNALFSQWENRAFYKL